MHINIWLFLVLAVGEVLWLFSPLIAGFACFYLAWRVYKLFFCQTESVLNSLPNTVPLSQPRQNEINTKQNQYGDNKTANKLFHFTTPILTCFARILHRRKKGCNRDWTEPTVEGENYTMEEILVKSDELVKELEKRYPAPVEK